MQSIHVKKEITGENTVIGIIDDGFYPHQAMKGVNVNGCRIYKKKDKSLTYEVLQTSQDDATQGLFTQPPDTCGHCHATAVAGIAAGKPFKGAFYHKKKLTHSEYPGGVAPDAKVVLFLIPIDCDDAKDACKYLEYALDLIIKLHKGEELLPVAANQHDQYEQKESFNEDQSLQLPSPSPPSSAAAPPPPPPPPLVKPKEDLEPQNKKLKVEKFDVVSMSLRVGDQSKRERGLQDPISQKQRDNIRKKINTIKEKGTHILATASNSGNTTHDLEFPAQLDEVISIGSLDPDANISKNSISDQKKVNLYCYGEVQAPRYTTISKLPDDLAYPKYRLLQNVSGSSFAAPAIAGLICLMMQHARKCGHEKTYTKDEILNAIRTKDKGHFVTEVPFDFFRPST